MNYYYIKPDTDAENRACLNKFDNIPFKKFKLRKCEPLQHLLEEELIYKMNDNEEARVLYDCVYNISGSLVISEPFRQLFSEFNSGNCEFLPVRVKDQRGKIVPEKFFIVNLIDDIEYMDLDKTIIRYSHVDETAISYVENVVVKNRNIPQDRDIFRSKSYSSGYVISERLKNRIEEEELEGIIFYDVKTFNSATDC